MEDFITFYTWQTGIKKGLQLTVWRDECQVQISDGKDVIFNIAFDADGNYTEKNDKSIPDIKPQMFRRPRTPPRLNRLGMVIKEKK